MIKELEDKPKDSSYDEEIQDLKKEKNRLQNVLKEIGNKNIYNFLSDEGLLPNYAFPEAGIILRAMLDRKEEEEPATGQRRYEKMVYEYNRSASSAISEFAPRNDFYVDGRKLTIDQVDLTTAQSAPWRLCPNCSHAQIEEAGRIRQLVLSVEALCGLTPDRSGTCSRCKWFIPTLTISRA